MCSAACLSPNCAYVRGTCMHASVPRVERAPAQRAPWARQPAAVPARHSTAATAHRSGTAKSQLLPRTEGHARARPSSQSPATELSSTAQEHSLAAKPQQPPLGPTAEPTARETTKRQHTTDVSLAVLGCDATRRCQHRRLSRGPWCEWWHDRRGQVGTTNTRLNLGALVNGTAAVGW